MFALLGFLVLGLPDTASSSEVYGIKEFSPVLTQQWAPGEFIAKFKKGISQDVIQQISRQHGTSMISMSKYGKFMRFRIPKGRTVDEMVAVFSHNPNVEYAEPNYLAHVLMTPNDTYYPYQWHLDNPVYGGIHMEPAWNVQTGSPAVIVAVVDTGVAYENYGIYKQAPDLAGTSFVPGYDFINNDSHPNDDHSHGTHVTGTLAQTTNNNMGVAGVAFGTSIMPVKVLDANGSGTITAIADGIYFAANNGAKVISMSFGTILPSATLEDAIIYAHDVKGVTLVCAAGNYGSSYNFPLYPAVYGQCIAVSATRYDEARAPYSNYGTYVDVAAPGGDTSVDQNNDGYVDGVLQQTFDTDPAVFSYWFFQGTSMATPHVSGVAALLIAHGVATPAGVREALEMTAEDKGPPGKDPEFGWGLVDAFASLNYVSSPVHDVAVTEITGPSWALQGDIIPIGVNVDNQGGYDESLTVTLNDATAAAQIGQQNISLVSGSSQNVVFQWDTTQTSLGNHVLEAVADTVPGENESSDNTQSTVVDILQPAHDVAVIAVDTPLNANVGDVINVSVTVQNQGTYSETTNVGLLDTFDRVPVGPAQQISLNAGESLIASFSWDTTGEIPGNHTLQATASAVSGETDIDDNTLPATTTINEVTNLPRLSVSDIQIDLRSKGPNYQAKAIVIVQNESLEPVQDATVTVLWTQIAEDATLKYFETVSGTTNRRGKASLNTDTVKAVSGDIFTIVILDVVKDGYSYLPGLVLTDSVVVP